MTLEEFLLPLSEADDRLRIEEDGVFYYERDRAHVELYQLIETMFEGRAPVWKACIASKPYNVFAQYSWLVRRGSMDGAPFYILEKLKKGIPDDNL